MKTIEVQGLSKAYNGKTLFKDLSFSADRGDILYIKGESGSGKTTLLHIIAKMESPDEGEIAHTGYTVSYAPCSSVLLEALTIRENLLYALTRSFMPQSYLLAEIRDLFIAYGLSLDILYEFPHDLSSGEYKRVLIIRTLLSSATVLLLDEPTANLDSETADKVVNNLNEYLKKHTDKLVIIATHDKRFLDSCPPEKIIDIEKER